MLAEAVLTHAAFLAHGAKLAEVVQSILCALHCQSLSWRIQDEALLCNLLLSAQLAKWHFLSHAEWQRGLHLFMLKILTMWSHRSSSWSTVSCNFRCSWIIKTLQVLVILLSPIHANNKQTILNDWSLSDYTNMIPMS